MPTALSHLPALPATPRGGQSSFWAFTLQSIYSPTIFKPAAVQHIDSFLCQFGCIARSPCAPELKAIFSIYGICRNGSAIIQYCIGFLYFGSACWGDLVQGVCAGLWKSVSTIVCQFWQHDVPYRTTIKSFTSSGYVTELHPLFPLFHASCVLLESVFSVLSELYAEHKSTC